MNSSIKVANFDKICRLCLERETDLVKFPECYYMGNNISEVLELYTDVRVKKDEDAHLPQQICFKCLTSLIEVHNFVKRCNESESLLRNLVEPVYVIANEGNELTSVFDAIEEAAVIKDEEEEGFITNAGDKVEEMTISNLYDVLSRDMTPEIKEKMAIAPSVVVAKKEPIITSNKIVPCDTCGTLFPTIKQMRLHSLQHKSRNDIKAEIDKILRRVNKKPRIVEKKDIKPKQQAPKVPTVPTCNLCTDPVVFESFLLLRRHKQKMHRIRLTALCNVCGKAFSGQWKLAQHMFAHSKEKNFTCDVCGANFRYIGNMHRHRLLHTGPRKYKCECGKAFTQSSSLKVHKLTHIIERCECNTCGHVTMNRAAHHAHMQRHKRHLVGAINSIKKSPSENSDLEKFVCKACKNEFESSAALKQHYSEQHRDKMHLCPHCGKEFKVYSNFYQHIRTHTGTRRFKCRYCDKAFTHSQSRVTHEHLHLGIRPHKCDQCDRTFVQQQQLKQHKLIHTGEKPHSCPHCGKRFRMKGNLIVHIRTHTGERPYVCTNCNAGFYDSSSLKKHCIKKCSKVLVENNSYTFEN